VRLAVSTLGLPGQTLAESVAIAADAGCAGLELRLHPDTGVHLGLSEEEQRSAREVITARSLRVLALAGYAKVAAPGPDAPVIAEMTAGLRLAGAFGATGLRVFPGGADTAAAVRRIRAAVRESPGPARILVETHDELPTGRDVARLLETAAEPERTGAIWDLLHPWRHGEQPARTLAALGNWLAYPQIKDAVSATDTTPVLLGAGSVPLDEAGALLRDAGYDGWVSLEWERTWYPQVPPVTDVLPGARQWISHYQPNAPLLQLPGGSFRRGKGVLFCKYHHLVCIRLRGSRGSSGSPQGVVQAGDAQQPDQHRGRFAHVEGASCLLRVFRHAQQRAQAPRVAESNSRQVDDHGALVTVDNRPDTLQRHIGGDDIQLAVHIHDGLAGGQCPVAQSEKH
jgi:sugar phosphate isomerase/epimerase